MENVVDSVSHDDFFFDTAGFHQPLNFAPLEPQPDGIGLKA
jgi:hypothetical protein